MHPSAKGRGLGSAVLAPVLDKADAEGVPCYLENSNPRNTPFYTRLGFVEVNRVPYSGPPHVEGAAA